MPIVVRNLETQEQVEQLRPNRDRVDASAPKASGCCGGAAPSGTEACCALDAEVKASGGTTCGCGTPAATPKAAGCC